MAHTPSQPGALDPAALSDDESWALLAHRMERAVSAPASPRRPVRSVWGYAGCMAAVLLVAALGALAAVRFVGTEPPPAGTPPAPRRFATDRGQRSSIHLADGSDVRLGPESRLEVPARFEGPSREVILHGEAFFDVAPDAARPFRIEAGAGRIEVRGTAFSVRTAGEQTTVYVAEGLVALLPSALMPDTVLVQPGRLAVISNRGVTVESADAERYLGWLEGNLVFRGASFDEVERELERWYDLQVDLLAPRERVLRLDAAFGDEPLSEILNTIAAALGLEYTRERRHITFYPASTITTYETSR